MGWPHVEYEERPWQRDPDALALISKTKRRAIGSTYRAAVPPHIAALPVPISQGQLGHAAELGASLARFDAFMQMREYDLPAVLLRSESASSSQIEHLTSSVRNVALAEISQDAPANATMIAANIAAMREALGQEGPIDVPLIKRIHQALMPGDDEFRDEQVWIGGTPYSPHGADFVPPHPERVGEYVDDLISFSQRADVHPIAKAAIVHAQFETIHPFVDGNGRTGRALLHRVLKSEGVLLSSTLPVSAGLLHNVDSYMGALDAYHDGNVEDLIDELLDALEMALVLGTEVTRRIDEIVEDWMGRLEERSTSAIWRLPNLLLRHPVVGSALVASELGISQRAAVNLIDRACDLGMLSLMGNRRRERYYQATDIVDLLEEVSSVQGIRRVAKGQLGK